MEAHEGLSPSIEALREGELAKGFRVASRTTLNQERNSRLPAYTSPSPTSVFETSTAKTETLLISPDVSGTRSFLDAAKRKRGRPRKYGADGALTVATLSPMPLSASIPLSGDFSSWKPGRGKAVERLKKPYKYDCETSGEKIAYTVGANFTPHVLRVNSGEDITMRVMSFAQQGSRGICVLSANGTISNVTLRQPNSSGGTLTYEGRFEILSLSGSFMPTENDGTKSRSGGMSVSLAGPDGRVVGGGLCGLLLAAGPVLVVVGSFLPGHHQEQKQKKKKIEAATYATPTSVTIISEEDLRSGFGAVRPIAVPADAPFLGFQPAAFNPMNCLPTSTADNTTSSADDNSKGLGSSYEVSC